MIGFIRGYVISKETKGKLKELVIFPYKDKKAHGIGYSVIVGENLAASVALGKVIELWLYSYITEKESYLLGVDSIQSMRLFKRILNVSGVGPRMALAIVDFFENIETFFEIIRQKDTTKLAKVPGLGKKTAAKIIVSLAEEVENLEFVEATSKNIWQKYPEYELLFRTLQSLGYSRAQISDMIIQKQDELRQAFENHESLDNLVKIVLKNNGN